MTGRKAEETIAVDVLNYSFRLRADGRLINRLSLKQVGRKLGAVMDFKHGPGYLGVRVDGKRVLSHRVVFAMTHGRWPNGDVDHINGDRMDNRPENLREASRSENLCNRTKLHPKNKSGTTGVFRVGATGKWRAAIKKDGRLYCLGDFDDKRDAVRARLKGEAQHMGEFAPQSNKQ